MTCSLGFLESTMYTVNGGVGSHEAVTVTFTGGDRTTCLVIHKPSNGEAQI